MDDETKGYLIIGAAMGGVVLFFILATLVSEWWESFSAQWAAYNDPDDQAIRDATAGWN